MKVKFLFFVAGLLAACEYHDAGLNSNPIDSEIRIETREVLGADSRRLTFHCQTERIYSCYNFPILTETRADENQFKITFTGVGEPMLCLTALGPASATIDLTTVAIGDYRIEFNNALLKSSGILRVTDSEIELLFLPQNGIEIVRPVTRRVPPGTYWGTIGYHTTATADRVNEFVEKLKAQGAVFSEQTPGHYFYYEIDEHGKMVVDARTSGYYFVRGIVFQYDGDDGAFNEQVRALAAPYFDDMYINIETYKGERIHNWN